MNYDLDNPRRWYVLKDLSPSIVLALLREAVKNAPAAARYLGHAGIQTRRAKFGLSCDLYVPETRDLSGKPQREARPLFEALKNAWKTQTNRELPDATDKPSDLASLPKRLPCLLLDDAPEHAAELVTGESLLLAPEDIAPAGAAEALKHLSHHATNVCWAAASGVDGKERYFFLVKDDPGRVGNLEAIWPRLAEEGFIRLRTFSVDGVQIHLPDEFEKRTVCPDRQALAAFGNLLKECPYLYTSLRNRPGGSIAPTTGSLLALAEVGRAGQRALLNIYWLGGVEFRTEFPLYPEGIDTATFQSEFHDLSDSDAAKASLVEELKRSDGYEGYRLRIKDTRLVWGRDAVNEQYLEEQRDFYDFKLHLHRAARQPRPTLLRFYQSQLGAMAQVLRRTPHKYLQDNRILYGFFAPARPEESKEPGFHFPELAVHYLFYEQGWSELEGHDPLIDWQHPSSAPIKFWLDPFWVRHYTPAEGVNSLVFVPESCALFPTMHSWEPPDMDEYLRKTLRDLLPDRLQQSLDSPTLMYLFESKSSDDDIQITILDKKDFAPFGERLSWVNDYISVNEAIKGSPVKLTQALGRDANAALVLQELNKHVEQVQERLLRNTKEVIKEIETDLVTNLGSLDTAIKQYAEGTSSLLENAAAFNDTHSELKRFFDRLKPKAEGLEKKPTEVPTKTKEHETKFDQMYKTLTEKVAAITTKRAELAGIIERELKELRRKREELAANLRRRR